MKAQVIVDALREAGLVVEHYLNNKNIECVLVDDYPRSKMLLDLIVGINGRGLPAVFGYYSNTAGEEWSLSGSICDWLENFGQDLPAMAAGNELNW